MFSFSLLCLLSTGKVLDFDAAGAVSGEDGDTAVAFNNTALMNKLFDSLDAGVRIYEKHTGASLFSVFFFALRRYC